MSDALTRVMLAFHRRRSNVYLRFGAPLHEHIVDRRRRVALFAPGAVFARVIWEGNDYGTTLWQISVMQAKSPDQSMERIAGVQPGAALLLHASSGQQAQSVLQLIDHIEAQGIDPTDVPADYWRTVQSRLATRGEIPPYGADRHAAHLVRRELT